MTLGTEYQDTRDAYEQYARNHPTKAARMLAVMEATPEFELARCKPRIGGKFDGLRLGLDGATRCRRCGRRLESEESKARKLGDDCWAKLKKAVA